MAVYLYQAREAGTGREIRGSVDASSEQTAMAALRGRNLFVLSLREKDISASSIHRSVRLMNLAAFTRQLTSMLDAGLTIPQALQTLSTETASRTLQKVITDILKQIDSGESFSGALQKHPEVFSRLYVNMVDAGERGGILPNILARLATYSEKTHKLRSKVRAALLYPTIVSLVAIAVVSFLLIMVVPTFSNIYQEQKIPLPAFTQFVITLANSLKDNVLYYGMTLGALILGSFSFIRTPAGRAWWDGFKLKLPVLGPLFHKLALSRFARTTSSLIHSGVPILEVLNVVSATVNNVQMEAALRSSALRIERGDTLSGALSTYPIFPAIILRMITAGEQGGAVDTMLEKVSDYMDDELDQALSGLTSLIEPILIIFLGVMIGGMVLAMLLPVFDMVNHVR
ncbi:MAG: type II secretion system F family protein [Clostridia bacterium]|nr:type II secretion system F family protein [Clostridia bacterium]